MILRRLVLATLLMIPAGAWAQQSQNPNPSFNLANRASGAVKEFFATPAGRANWGRDRLDGKGLAAGASFPVRLPADGNCIYDLRVVFADGRSEEQRGVNACKIETVSVGQATAGATAPAGRGLTLKNESTSPITEALVRPVGGNGQPVTNLTQGSTIAAGAEGRFELPGNACVFDLRVKFADGQVRTKNGADLCRSPVQGVR